MTQAIRTWTRRPWLAAAAILSVALGIGANTAIFSVMNAVVLRPLPYPEPDRLVALWEASADNPSRWLAPANFLDWRREARTLSSMAVFDGFPLTLTGRGEAERLNGAGASGTFFDTLGVTAAAGRTLRPADDAPGAAPVAVLAGGLAARLFGGTDRAIGQILRLEGRAHEVVGVLPDAFTMPMLPTAEIWVNGDRGIPRSFPFPGDVTTVRDAHYLLAVGRLAPGVSPAAAEQELTAVMTRLAKAFPATNAGLGARVVPLHSQVVGDVSRLVVFLQLAVIAMLAIGCANVASLLLGQAAGRQRELATRIALGARRRQVVVQLLAEAVAIATPGGLLGLLLALWGLDVLVAIAPASLPRVAEIGIDGRVLVFTLVATFVTAVAFGLGPALGAARRAGIGAAQPGERVAGDRAISRWHRVLVVGELATAQVLLAGAGLLIASLLAAQQVPLGFEAHGRLAADVSLAPERYLQPAASGDGRIDAGPRRRLVAHVLATLEATPGVRAAAAAFTAPMGGAPNRGLRIVGDPEPRPNEEPQADFQLVTPAFFRTNGIRLTSGRTFDASDRAGSLPVAIVNQAMADRYFAGRNPIGHEIAFNQSLRHQIVGVVADARYRDVEHPAAPTFYVPMDQNDERWPYLSFMAWSDGDAAALAPVVRAAVRDVDPDQPLARVRTYDEILARMLASRRFTALLAGVFAAVALVLAALGTYGVLAYAVGARTRELGVRAALGASPGDLRRLVMRQGGALAGLAIALGGGAAWLAGGAMASLLFQVRPGDPWTLALVTALLALVALAATWLPARSATAVDPLRALREP